MRWLAAAITASSPVASSAVPMNSSITFIVHSSGRVVKRVARHHHDEQARVESTPMLAA